MTHCALVDLLSSPLHEPITCLNLIDRCEDLRRSRDRDIVLSTIHTMADIRYDEDFVGLVRFVVTSENKLILAPEGMSSKHIPQHREMSKGLGCIAAGILLLSDDRRIIGIRHDSGDYHPDVSTLIWPLTIINLHPHLIHPDFRITIVGHNDAGGFEILQELPMSPDALSFMLEAAWRFALNADLKDAMVQADRTTVNDRIFYKHERLVIENFTKKRTYGGLFDEAILPIEQTKCARRLYF